jgi:hypothetical protein
MPTFAKSSAKPITTTQTFSRTAFQHLLQHIDALPDDTKKVLRFIQKTVKNTMKNTISVTYKPKETAGVSYYGRYYSANGFEHLNRETRSALCAPYYHDIDIANCHPVLLSQLAKRVGFKCTELDYYVGNRDAVLTQLMKYNPEWNRDDAKMHVTAVINGSRTEHLADLKAEVHKFAEFLSNKDDFQELYAAAVAKAANGVAPSIGAKKSKFGTFMAYIGQTIERECLEAMIDAFKARDWAMETLIYDGGLVRKRTGKQITPELLREIEIDVEVATGYCITLVEKPFASVSLAEETAVTEKIYPADFTIDDKFATEEFIRIMGPDLIKENGSIFVYNPNTGMWESGRDAIKAAIQRNADKLTFKQETHNGGTKVIGYGGSTKMSGYIMSELPTLVPSSTYLSDNANSAKCCLLFTDGIYDMRTATFTKGFDRTKLFTARILRPFPTASLDQTMSEINQALFVNPFQRTEDGIYYKNRLARAIAGHTEDKILHAIIGEANTGKTTAIMLAKRAFGGYVKDWNADYLKFRPGSTTDEAKKMSWIGDVINCRLAISSEARMDGIKFDGNMAKRLSSGGDTLTYRQNFQDERTITLQTTFMIMANDLPDFSPADAALKSRASFVRFDYSFVEKPEAECTEWEKPCDPLLKDKVMSAEWADAFLLLILDAYQKGYAVPKPLSVIQETNEFVPVEDSSLRSYLAEEFELVEITGDDDWVSAKILQDYIAKGNFNMSAAKVGREFRKLGLTPHTKKVAGRAMKVWRGIRG